MNKLEICAECKNNNHNECIQMINGESKPCPCWESECLSTRHESGKLHIATEQEEQELISKLYNERMERIAEVFGLNK